MKATKLLGLIMGTVILVSVATFPVLNAHAIYIPPARKLMKVCADQSGGIITFIGNTCDVGGDGCISNPCGQ